MMRYSEIPREFSSDSIKFPEDLGEYQLYRSLRDESPISDVSTRSGFSGHTVPLLTSATDATTPNKKSSETCNGGKNFVTPTKANGCSNGSNGLYKKHCDKKQHTPNAKEVSRRRNNSAGGILPMIHQLHQQQTAVLTNHHSLRDSPSTNGHSNYTSLASTLSPPPLPPSIKTQSLPLNASINDLDAIILSALRISPEELAGQITLLDFPAFSKIEPDELTSCAWTKKDKYTVAPNIVAFTKRFNHTSFWTIQEILSGPTPKKRAEIMSHFIKVAKKLHELNNLHSLFAVCSAMQTASIYRLSKSWSNLSKKDRSTFDRLIAIFNDDNNWKNLRDYLESLKLPCIPYLGLYLTDLVYIDCAHPHTGGLESEQRRTQMNNILRIISNYQSSDYSHIQPIPQTQKYIQSIRYIEELQNIFEDDQYKKSLILEPPTPVPNSSSGSNSSKESVLPASYHHHIDPSTIASLNLSPAKSANSTANASIPSGSMRLSSATKFIPGHRKCRSLGSKFRSTSLPRNFHHGCTGLVLISRVAAAAGTTSAGTAKLSTSSSSSCQSNYNSTSAGPLSLSSKCKCRIFNKTNGQVAPISTNALYDGVKGISNACYDNGACHVYEPRHLLDDSLLVSNEPSIGTSSSRCGSADELSTESGDGINSDSGIGSSTTGACIAPISYFETDSDHIIQDDDSPLNSNDTMMEGCVRRKTVLKDGRKPAVASWQRYWLQLYSNSLLYFAPKSFKGTSRNDFKREPCKMCFLDGWAVQLMDNPQQVNTFQLVNSQLGTVYKFRTGSPQMTSMWLTSLRRIANSLHQHEEKTLPVNLMSFE